MELDKLLETIGESVTQEFKNRYDDLIKITRKQKGYADDDDYMRGLYNGLELACSVIEKREAVYK